MPCEGIPEDRVRFHICWGSWHGPHSDDVPLKDVVDLLLKVKAQALLGRGRQRAPRARMEGLAGRTKLPDGKLLIPGVVSHATNVLEHPELVADRIVHYASVVGRENVIASTDCGLGGRVHPQIAWAKLPRWRRAPRSQASSSGEIEVCPSPSLLREVTAGIRSTLSTAGGPPPNASVRLHGTGSRSPGFHVLSNQGCSGA